MGRPCKPRYLRNKPSVIKDQWVGEDPNASTGGSILPCRKCRNCHVLFHVSGIFQHERVCNTKRENGTLVSHALEHESSMICHETAGVENNTSHDKDQGNLLENGGTDDSAVGISEKMEEPMIVL